LIRLMIAKGCFTSSHIWNLLQIHDVPLLVHCERDI
jgi:hypothetical protein